MGAQTPGAGVGNVSALHGDTRTPLVPWKQDVWVTGEEMQTLALIQTSLLVFIIAPRSMNCKVVLSPRRAAPGPLRCPFCLFLVLILEATNIHAQETNLRKLYQRLCREQSERAGAVCPSSEGHPGHPSP